MDLQGSLIESQKQRSRKSWKQWIASLVAHGGFIALIIFVSTASATKHVVAAKPIPVFVSHSAAAPPPPPPPPPPAASSAPRATPHPTPTPVHIQQPRFVQPREVPQELPKVESVATTAVTDTPMASSYSEPASEPGGQANGVAGGVTGGVEGGVVGGTVGGQVGGQIGGTVGGQIGGMVGGTGTSVEPAAPSPDASGPLRVGGDVKAPVVSRRVQPNYPEIARRGRISGVVIVEAIIDKDGNVDHVKVLKGLPMGLSDEAERAVKQWKFRPGTMNGQPVDVIFNLVVDFKLDGSVSASASGSGD